MYWHKVLMIYSFYVYRICIFIPLFITDIYNLRLFFSWSTFLGAYWEKGKNA